MDAYIKTIINGLKAWVTSCLSRLESNVSGSLASMADKLTSLSSKVQQAQTTAQSAQSTATNAQTTAANAQTTATNAQSTATNAQSTATNAQSTATNAQSTATNAQSTAQSAKNMANAAQTTAANAQSTATNAQSTATNAQSTANQAKTTAEGALPKKGGNMTGGLCMNGIEVIGSTGSVRSTKSFFITPGDSATAWGEFKIVKNSGDKTQFWVDRDESDINSAHTILFVANGGGTIALEGINVIQMKSTSGKKFNITVSDDGTLTTTEVTT